MHQGSMLGNGETGAEFIGLNGKVILKLLSVKIDDRLVNFAKWHIFKAFELQNNLSFDKLFIRPSLKNPKYVASRIFSKTWSKVTNLPEHDDRYAAINNKYLDIFVKKNKIIEKYNDFKSNHKYRELMYEFPNRENRFNLKETSNNFWKINNIVNIVRRIS